MTEGHPKELVFEKPSALEFVSQVAEKLQPGEMARGTQVVGVEVVQGLYENYPKMKSRIQKRNRFEIRRVTDKVVIVGLQLNKKNRGYSDDDLFEGAFVFTSKGLASGRSIRHDRVVHRAFSDEELSDFETKAIETVRDSVLVGQMKLEVDQAKASPKFMDTGFTSDFMNYPGNPSVQNALDRGHYIYEEQHSSTNAEVSELQKVHSAL